MQDENDIPILANPAVQEALSALVQASRDGADIGYHLYTINTKLPSGYMFRLGDHEHFFIYKGDTPLRHEPRDGQRKGPPIQFRGGIEAWKGAMRYVWAHDLLGLAPNQEVPK